MKNIVFSLVLGSSFIATGSVNAAPQYFSTSQMAQVKIKELSFREIMRKFYSGQMGFTSADDEYIKSMPNIGLGQVDENGMRTVALMHPVGLYDNAKGEPRYLITIEKVVVFDDSSEYCEPCGSKADLYTFKRLNDGQFQLVSKTKDSVIFYEKWGTMNLENNDIQKDLQRLGRDLVGSIFKSVHMVLGETSSWWAALHLPENDFINVYYVGDAGTDNGGQQEEDSPLYYDYKSLIKVMPENSDYYPIKLTYKGIPPDDPELPKFINRSFIMKFNPEKQSYESVLNYQN